MRLVGARKATIIFFFFFREIRFSFPGPTPLIVRNHMEEFFANSSSQPDLAEVILKFRVSH